MTRDLYERLILDGYVPGLDAPDDDIDREMELELAGGELLVPAERDEFADDEIDAHLEMSLAA